jgi:hypothetical protein
MLFPLMKNRHSKVPALFAHFNYVPVTKYVLRLTNVVDIMDLGVRSMEGDE